LAQCFNNGRRVYVQLRSAYPLRTLFRFSHAGKRMGLKRNQGALLDAIPSSGDVSMERNRTDGTSQ
jgi:hypothetical protein